MGCVMMDDDPVRNLALEGIDRAAQADDLLKPTEERVREIVEQLREPNADNGDHSQYDEWAMRFNAASFLEILSAENKALREKAQDCNWAPYNLQSIWKAEEQIEWEAADRIEQLEREKAEESGWAISNRDACNAAERDADILAEAVYLLKIYCCFDDNYFDSPTINHAFAIAERRVKG